MGFGVTGIYAFRFKKEDITTRPSQLTLGFAHTLNKQVLIYLPYQLFAKQQVFNIYGELGYYLYSYQFLDWEMILRMQIWRLIKSIIHELGIIVLI